MNIFHLDHNINLSAQYHCDKHVCKQILEYAQMLSTAHRILDGSKQQIIKNNRKLSRYILEDPILENTFYLASHVNHPCNIWIRQNSANYIYLYDLFINLCNEFKHRYNKDHKTFIKLAQLLKNLPKNIPLSTQFNIQSAPQCMPDQYKQTCVISAYRNFYIYGKALAFKVTWKNRQTPQWFINKNI